MDPKELMLFDLVRYRTWNMRVTSVNAILDECMHLCWLHSNVPASIDIYDETPGVRPLNITEHRLIKNGFKKISGKYLKFVGGMRVLEVSTESSTQWRFQYRVNGHTHFSSYIRFMHQLQQSLRLAGFMEEANSFTA